MKNSRGDIWFVDASHLVYSAFLGCLWSRERIFIKSPSGRSWYNVLGAFNPIRCELITVKNEGYVNATTVIELIRKLREKYRFLKITLVMDNARYQRCAAVMECARENDVQLLFLPSYSPNLNLIERLWKFVKKNALNNKYYTDFISFKAGIDECLENIKTKYKSEVMSLMSLNFHIVHNAK